MFNSLLLYLIYFHIKLSSSGWFFVHYYYHCGRLAAPDVCKLFCYTHKCHCEQISCGVDNNQLINECERETKHDRDKRRLFHEYRIPYACHYTLWCMRNTVTQNTNPLCISIAEKSWQPHQRSEKIERIK